MKSTTPHLGPPVKDTTSTVLGAQPDDDLDGNTRSPLATQTGLTTAGSEGRAVTSTSLEIVENSNELSISRGPETVDTRVQGTSSPPVTGLRKWEGRVLSIQGQSFWAELVALDRDDSPAIHAEFDLKHLEADSADEIQPGDVFYLTVRFVRGASGTSKETASLKLRRLGRWSTDEISEIRRKALERLAGFE